MTTITIMGKVEYNRDNQQDNFTFASFDVSNVDNYISLETQNIVLQAIINSKQVQEILQEAKCYMLFCGEINDDNFVIIKIHTLVIETYPTEIYSTFNFE